LLSDCCPATIFRDILGLSVSYFTHPTRPFSYVIERGGLAGSLPHVTNPPPSSA